VRYCWVEQSAVQLGRLLPIDGATSPGVSRPGKKDHLVRKILPQTMFTDPERSRLTMLRSWVLDHEVSEIEMTERQFWIFAQLQPVAEKPDDIHGPRHLRARHACRGAKTARHFPQKHSRRHMTPGARCDLRDPLPRCA
jgi:hypothetical protein